jgi:hypothetical protein
MIARRVLPQFCFAITNITVTGLDFGSRQEEELMGQSICIRLVRHPHRAHLSYTQTSEPSTWANIRKKNGQKWTCLQSYQSM